MSLTQKHKGKGTGCGAGREWRTRSERKRNYLGVDQEYLRYQNEDSEENTGEQIQVQEPLNKGKEGYKAGAKVSFHVAETPVPQLNFGYHLPQSALGLWEKKTMHHRSN